jgi:cytochrome c biogenesis protein CcdA
MKILLFAHDVIGVWAAQLKLVSVPAILVGVAIGCTVRRWIACLVVSYAAALGLISIMPHFRHPWSVSELMVWSAGLALPTILASMSLGYFAARGIQTRRAKQQVT